MARTVFVVTVLVAGLAAAQDDYDRAVLDDFEEVTAWTRGAPAPDLAKQEYGCAGSDRFVKGGKQSLAFMVRVDWTPKPGERYPKGWPMIWRRFEAPQDWSGYDRLEFWVYTETEAQLPDPALKYGIAGADGAVHDPHWHAVPGVAAGQWVHVSVPLTDDLDWAHVTGIWFYIAEAWYQDGDRVTFYLDDMRLARRRTPRIVDCGVTARTHPRGEAADLRVAMEGPTREVRVRAKVLRGEVAEATWEGQLSAKRQEFVVPLRGVSPGGRMVALELLDREGRVVDATQRFLEVLDPQRKPYLSLVTFYTPHLLELSVEKLAVLNDTPYDGVAVPVEGGYDTGEVREYGVYAEQVQRLKERCRFHVWPWVFVNRIIGRESADTAHPSSKDLQSEYFARIKCMDLDDAAGARSEMLAVWRQAVRLAKDLGAPGVVLDLEAYNNYRAYEVPHVAARRGETVGQVVRACEEIGAELGRIVEQEYPQCVVWSLFSHLRESAAPRGVGAEKVYTTVGHITLGFLKYCREHGLPARYLCGGETEVGYYNQDAQALRARIRSRDWAYESILREFPQHFALGGTIAPYHDHTLLTDWIRNQAGDNPQLKTIEDFRPMFRTLFDAYDWVWIYAASAARADPYDAENAKRYGEVLRGALGQ